MAIWLVLLISCASLVLGRKHTNPLEMLDLEDLIELKEAFENELAVGHDVDSDELDSSEISLSESKDNEDSESSSDYSDDSEDLENSSDESEDSESLEDSDDSEESVGVQDKDGWVIYPEWSQWDPTGKNKGYHPVEEDKPVAQTRPRRRYRHRHRAPHRRYRRRRKYRRRRPRRERSVGRGRSRRHSRRHHHDDYTADEVEVGSALRDYLSDLEDELALGNDFEDSEEALGADMPDYLFDYDDSEEAVGSNLFADDSDSFERNTLERLLDAEDF